MNILNHYNINDYNHHGNRDDTVMFRDDLLTIFTKSYASVTVTVTCLFLTRSKD